MESWEKEIISDIRITIPVDTGYNCPDMADARELLEMVRDHKSLAAHKPYISFDREVLCMFCGRTCDPDPVTKEPYCCGKAQNEFQKEITIRLLKS
jgi:hypothetical protein